ncbi:M23 family metallopeptidase [Vallitalea okinawensis]|uniref:M23 family metallopeptidase n=1 Tax=Vallitalea okinawensis TaxID=2078660 RepID=UPI000CFD28AD|nr:M23 family metallopeptidase [Vallitalea okinawensis]
MLTKKRAYILPVLLLVVLLCEWISVFFIGGIIGVVCWWFIIGGSIIASLIVIVLIALIGSRLVRGRKIHYALTAALLIALMMGYPILWLFDIGQMAYPVHSPILPAASIRLPIDQTTVVGWGGNSLETNRPHAIVPMERWAYDLLIDPYSVSSNKLSDYGIYDVEVIAPISGIIIDVYDQEDDILPGAADNETMMGNYIYMRLDTTDTYLIFAHLKKDSVLVQIGQYVEEGTPIARVGNSGSSSEPHLHIHHQRQNPLTTSMFLTEGLPLYFRDIDGPPIPKGGIIKDIITPIN